MKTKTQQELDKIKQPLPMAKEAPMQVPICYACGKSPLRCGKPNKCEFEDL